MVSMFLFFGRAIENLKKKGYWISHKTIQEKVKLHLRYETYKYYPPNRMNPVQILLDGLYPYNFYFAWYWTHSKILVRLQIGHRLRDFGYLKRSCRFKTNQTCKIITIWRVFLLIRGLRFVSLRLPIISNYVIKWWNVLYQCCKVHIFCLLKD